MNIRRYYNQNRKKIWGILIIIASAFILLQLVNYLYKISHEKTIAAQKQITEEKNLNTNDTIVSTNRSVVTGQEVARNELETVTAVIDNFISYCNNRELEEAYNILTEECKAQMYRTLEIFEKAYYNDVFKGEEKTATIENWIGNTYKVSMQSEILSLGKKNSSTPKQDYMTIIRVGDEYKLNINHYIGITQINKTTNQTDISMEVICKNTYMEYEEYTLKVTNHTDHEILLDTRKNTDTLYLQDRNEVKYASYSHELTDPMLTVSSGETKEVTIKFYNSFRSNKRIRAIVFSDIVADNDMEGETRVSFRVNV